jgi:hypothetical protein
MAEAHRTDDPLVTTEKELRQAIRSAVTNLKATEKLDIPQPTLADKVKKLINDYGIIALIILAITAYLALNDKLLELNRSMGRVEGEIQILQQLKLLAPTP